MRCTSLLLLSAPLLLAACSQELSDEDTRKAWAVTNAILAQGGAQAQAAGAGVPALPGQNSELRPRMAAMVDYTLNCPSGGTAHFVGDAMVDVASGSTEVSFNLSTEFNACDGNGVTISGSLDYAAAVSASNGAASTTLTMKGSLDYSGDVEGSCEIDMSAAVSGGPGTGGIGYAHASYSGSICGYDAGVLEMLGGDCA